MTQLPPIPQWSSLHPLIVHFPINHALLVAAFFLMVLATGFLYLTYFTGDAMATSSQVGPTVGAAIAHHCSMAGYTVSARLRWPQRYLRLHYCFEGF